MSKKIAVICYNKPTRKTQEVLLRLKGKGYNDVDVYAIPFILRKTLHPLIAHRPSELLVKIDNEQLVANLNFTYISKEIEELDECFTKKSYHSILIAGAGLLPESLVSRHKLINSHPGYLPYVRGLDALKWAIYKNLPIGVTVHYVDKYADAGLLITQEKLDILSEDTFHSMCFKLWNLEMQLLVDSIEIIDTDIQLLPLSTEGGESHRRMPKDKEKKLFQKFEEYKNRNIK
ncbi:formyltransferase family protein [uncultured Apibacter sp.]|uniref:formyltransferase family protein n=1 Tax=uncultured Apibacter sp. TaxID=1778616 RepID=UPI0025DB6511|nr:formyltransferase family protein [uncultured Apibacter sp.]